MHFVAWKIVAGAELGWNAGTQFALLALAAREIRFAGGEFSEIAFDQC